MTARAAAFGMWIAAVAAGTVADRPAPGGRRVISGYQVLATDFHVHSHPFSGSLLAPWDTVIQARFDSMDVIAMTPHNHVWVSSLGRWFSRRVNGPLVLVGEEITTPGYHLLAIGIERSIAPGLPLARAIDEVHGQHGVAIAAHPYPSFWPAYDAEVMRRLDRAEVVRPESLVDPVRAGQLSEFFSRSGATAIGASDFHGTGSIGYARTYVFAKGRTAGDVLEAVRNGRTLVYARDRVYGNPELARMAADAGGFPAGIPQLPRPGAVRALSRILALLGLAGMLLLKR